MVEYEYWEEGGMHCVRAFPPFNFKELYELGAKAFMRGGKAAEFWRPTLFDFRNVQIKKLDAEELVEIFKKRRSFGEEHNNNPSAYLVQDLHTHTMVRMSTAYADAHGLREEEKTIVTEDAGEATRWLASVMGLEEDQACRLEGFIA